MPDAAERLFKSVYVDEYRQIDRRLQEQAAFGNLERVGPATGSRRAAASSSARQRP